jgi:hypothetical protein
MMPMDDRGQAVVVKPWDMLTPEKKVERQRSLSTAHCFPYPRLERNGVPVCVEEERR